MSIAFTIEDFECGLCLKLLYRPTTTVCGHSFCKECLCKSLEHRSKCPVCRAVIHSSPHRLAVSTDLAKILEKCFPAEYAKRRKETEEMEKLELENEEFDALMEQELACFVLCSVLPRQRLQLHIFEPRYRLMTQRCLQGSRRFGIVPKSADFGTEVEIVECEELPGGRFYLEVIGIRVFHIVQPWVVDNYLTARVKFIVPDKNIQETDSEIVEQSEKLEELTDNWQQVVSRAGYERNNEQTLRFYRDLGPMPRATLPGDRALWIAALINPVRPLPQLAPDIRRSILKSSTAKERIEIVTQAIKRSMQRMNPTFSRLLARKVFLSFRKAIWFTFKYSWLILFGWYCHKHFPSSSSSSTTNISNNRSEL